MICKWCGEEVDAAQGVCPNCGRELSEQAEEREDYVLSADEPQEKLEWEELPLELKTEPVPETPVEDDYDDFEQVSGWTLLKQKLARPASWKIACGFLLAAFLIALFLFIRANNLLQHAREELERLQEQVETTVPSADPAQSSGTQESTDLPTESTVVTTEPIQTTEETEDPEAIRASEVAALHEQLQKNSTQLTLSFSDGAWTLQSDPEELAEGMHAAWDQIPLDRMDGYLFGRLYIRSDLLAGTENEELIQLWMGYQKNNGVILLNTELDVKNDIGFGERAKNGSEYLWQVRADSTEEWVSLRATGGGRMAELHPRVEDPELRLVCKRKNVDGGEIVIEVLGMHLSDLAAPKRTVVN